MRSKLASDLLNEMTDHQKKDVDDFADDLVLSNKFLTEDILVKLGFEKKLMIGTGYNSISSMCPPIYYYKNEKTNEVIYISIE